LSEYNLLYHDEKVFVIDVGQAVENDSPNALEFLRRDCHIINEFFKKKDVIVLTTQNTFEFVTDMVTLIFEQRERRRRAQGNSQR
jgi:RIO kinase 1